MTATAPTQAGFLAFIRQEMQIGKKELPDNSPAIPLSYDVAVELVNRTIRQASCLMYERAVYYLAADNLINFAADQPGCSYFTDLRKTFKISMFIPGIVQSTSDEGTSDGYVVQEAAKTFTLGNLQNMKTPYGRAYLAIAQSYGSIVGVT